MEKDIKQIICDFVDFLLPELTPYEASLYTFLFRNSFIRNGTNEIRIGKRTIAENFGKGARGEHTSYEHISETLKRLEQKWCIKVGDTNIKGTLYTVILPKDIPLVIEKMESILPQSSENNYFTDQEKRTELFERDKWICQYFQLPLTHC